MLISRILRSLWILGMFILLGWGWRELNFCELVYGVKLQFTIISLMPLSKKLDPFSNKYFYNEHFCNFFTYFLYQKEQILHQIFWLQINMQSKPSLRSKFRSHHHETQFVHNSPAHKISKTDRGTLIRWKNVVINEKTKIIYPIWNFLLCLINQSFTKS